MAIIKNLTNASATVNQAGDAIATGGNFTKCGNIGLQAIGTGLNTSDSTVTLEQSNDGVNWDDVYDSTGVVFTLTMASGTTSQSQVLTNMAMAYLRGVYTKNTNSAGTISIIFNFV